MTSVLIGFMVVESIAPALLLCVLLFIAVLMWLERRSMKGRFTYAVQRDGLAMCKDIPIKTIEYITDGIGDKPESSELDWPIYTFLVFYSSLFKQHKCGNFNKSDWKIVYGSIEKLFKSKAVREYWISHGIENNPLWSREFRNLGSKLMSGKSERP